MSRQTRIALPILLTALFLVRVAVAAKLVPPRLMEICSAVRSSSKYTGAEVWVRGRLGFVPPDSGLTLGGACSRVVDLTWSEESPFSKSLGRKSLDIAQQELFRDFTKLHRGGDVTVSVRGVFRKARNGHYVLHATSITGISISFLGDSKIASPVVQDTTMPKALGGPPSRPARGDLRQRHGRRGTA